MTSNTTSTTSSPPPSQPLSTNKRSIIETSEASSSPIRKAGECNHISNNDKLHDSADIKNAAHQANKYCRFDDGTRNKVIFIDEDSEDVDEVDYLDESDGQEEIHHHRINTSHNSDNYEDDDYEYDEDKEVEEEEHLSNRLYTNTDAEVSSDDFGANMIERPIMASFNNDVDPDLRYAILLQQQEFAFAYSAHMASQSSQTIQSLSFNRNLSEEEEGEGEYNTDDEDEQNFTYEQLLEIQEVLGEVKDRSMPPARIASLVRTQDDKSECSICMDSNTDSAGDCNSRILMECGHAFHEVCGVGWLRIKASCPVCRRVFE